MLIKMDLSNVLFLQLTFSAGKKIRAACRAYLTIGNAINRAAVLSFLFRKKAV